MKKILLTLGLTCILMLFFWNHTSLVHLSKNFYSLKDIPPHLLKNSQALISPNKEILIINAEGTFLQKLDFPYIEHDPHGITINYDNQRNIVIFNKQNMVFSSSDFIGYPRLSYPYILYFSEDLTSVQGAHITEPIKILFKINANDIISAWDTSPNAENLVVGTISGEIFTYQASTKKLKRSKSGDKPSFIISIGVENSGLYYTIGDEPKILSYSSMDSTDYPSHYKLEFSYSNMSTKPLKTKNYVFFPTTPQGFVYFKKTDDNIIQNKQLTPKTNDLFMVKELDTAGEIILLGYRLDTNTYFFEKSTKQGSILYSFYLSSEFIPILLEDKEYSYILSEKGVYRL